MVMVVQRMGPKLTACAKYGYAGRKLENNNTRVAAGHAAAPRLTV
jgi:hypothetical protein